jgi:two-component system cell cycle sensor histidine kinase/response regulator CckA
MANSDDCTAAHAKQTILVVEDSEVIRQVVCTMLDQNGYTCVEASNGAEALSVLRAGGKVQLVLSDVVMPKMGGGELADHVASEYPSIPMLFMSGYSDDPLVRAIERTPFFLPKPFTVAALTNTVRRALEQPWSGLPPWRRGSSAQ